VPEFLERKSFAIRRVKKPRQRKSGGGQKKGQVASIIDFSGRGDDVKGLYWGQATGLLRQEADDKKPNTTL